MSALIFLLLSSYDKYSAIILMPSYRAGMANEKLEITDYAMGRHVARRADICCVTVLSPLLHTTYVNHFCTSTVMRAFSFKGLPRDQYCRRYKCCRYFISQLPFKSSSRDSCQSDRCQYFGIHSRRGLTSTRGPHTDRSISIEYQDLDYALIMIFVLIAL